MDTAICDSKKKKSKWMELMLNFNKSNLHTGSCGSGHCGQDSGLREILCTNLLLDFLYPFENMS